MRRGPVPQPPLDLAAQLMRAYRAMVRSWADWLEAHVLAAWDQNLPLSPARTDAPGDRIDRLMGQAESAWAQPPQQDISKVATGVSARNLRETQGMIRAYSPTGVYQGRRAKKTLQDQPTRGTIKGISLKGVVDSAALKGFQTRNADLIRGLRKKTNARVRETLEKAYESGMRIDDLRRKLADELGIAESKADLIARDQVLKLNGDLTEERQRQAGIETYQWSTSGDERVRDMHADLDGTIQSWDDPPVTNEQGETNHPGQDVGGCRCVAIPILPELQ